MRTFLFMTMLLMAVLLTSCGTSNGMTKAEREAEITRQVQAAVDAQRYTITVDWMRPIAGRPRNVSSDYELKVDGNLVDSYLPYIGEAYRIPYGGGKGLNFKGEIKNYKVSRSTSNRYVIEFDVNNKEDVYHYRIDLFNNGKAIIDVYGHDHDAISFDGELVMPNM